MYDNISWGVKKFLNNNPTNTLNEQLNDKTERIENAIHLLSDDLSYTYRMAHPSNNQNQKTIFNGLAKKSNDGNFNKKYSELNLTYWTAPVTGKVRVFFQTTNLINNNNIRIQISENPKHQIDAITSAKLNNINRMHSLGDISAIINNNGDENGLIGNQNYSSNINSNSLLMNSQKTHYVWSLNIEDSLRSPIIAVTSCSEPYKFFVDIPVSKGYTYGFYSDYKNPSNVTLKIDVCYEWGAPYPFKKMIRIHNMRNNVNVYMMPAVMASKFVILTPKTYYTYKGSYNEFVLFYNYLELTCGSAYPEYITNILTTIPNNGNDRIDYLNLEGYEMW